MSVRSRAPMVKSSANHERSDALNGRPVDPVERAHALRDEPGAVTLLEAVDVAQAEDHVGGLHRHRRAFRCGARRSTCRPADSLTSLRAGIPGSRPFVRWRAPPLASARSVTARADPRIKYRETSTTRRGTWGASGRGRGIPGRSERAVSGGLSSRKAVRRRSTEWFELARLDAEVALEVALHVEESGTPRSTA